MTRALVPRHPLGTGAVLLLLCGATAALGWMSRRPVDHRFTSIHEPRPASPVTASCRVDRTSVVRGGDGLVRMELVLAADERGVASGAARRPTDLVVVLDRSGSMSGTKIEQAREAVQQVIGSLGPEDRFALVTYSATASLDAALSPASPESVRSLRAAVEGIRAGGGTSIARGLGVGLDVLDGSRGAERTARVLLVSDGLDATPGLTEIASRAVGLEAVLSTIGVGSDFNEVLMTSLADAGTGNFYYLDRAGELARVLREELEAARETVASNLVVSLRPGAGVRVVDAAGYPLERDGDTVVFRPGSLFSGQQRRVWITFRVPTSEPRRVDLGSVAVSYRDRGESRSLRVTGVPRIACVVDESEAVASIDRDAWSDAVVGEERSAVSQSVAVSVREGRKDEALRLIDSYIERNEALNAELGDAAVAESLEEARALKREVEATFEAPDVPRARKVFSKEKWATAQDARRAGSKKGGAR